MDLFSKKFGVNPLGFEWFLLRSGTTVLSQPVLLPRRYYRPKVWYYRFWETETYVHLHVLFSFHSVIELVHLSLFLLYLLLFSQGPRLHRLALDLNVASALVLLSTPLTPRVPSLTIQQMRSFPLAVPLGKLPLTSTRFLRLAKLK